MKKFIYPLFSLLILSACDTSVGQSGKYVDFKGKATITQIKEVSDSACKNSVEILFDFKPDNEQDLSKYKFNNFKDQSVTMFPNLKPSKAWVDKKGIKVGSTYSAKRSEIISGTSTPVVISITEDSVTNVTESDFCQK